MMTTIGQTMPAGAAIPGLLDRERIIAATGFNRWLVPPAALCIHLCIGMAYGFSVFWLPLSRALGITDGRAVLRLRVYVLKGTANDAWNLVAEASNRSTLRAGLAPDRPTTRAARE